MGYIKSKGIVIKEINTGEADKIISIFTKSEGKISGFAKNARKSKNRLAASTQFLCYSDFVLYSGKDLYTVSSCDVIEPFYEIRNDMVKLTYSAHIVDLINDMVQENQPATKLLQLFLNTLHMLAKTDKSPELLARIFEIRALSILGYSPYVRGCINCGETGLHNMAFSFKKCGFLCNNCISLDQYGMDLFSGTTRTLNHIVHANIKDLFNFNVSPEVLEQLEKLNRRYLRERLEKDYTKLDFLRTLGC